MVRPRLVRSGVVLLAGALMLAGSGFDPASAADVPKALRESADDDFGRAAVDSLDFMLAIAMTREQAREVLPAFEDACRLQSVYYREKAEVQAVEIEAYAEFLEEDKLNQGFTPELEQRTQRIHGRSNRLRDTLHTELNAQAESVWDVLTEDQRRIAETYRPDKQAVLDRFGSNKEQRRAERRAKQRAKRQSQQRRREDPRLREAEEELHDIQRVAHPHPDVVARFLLRPAAAQHVYKLADKSMPQVVREAVSVAQSGTREYPLAKFQKNREQLRELSSEINNWNLANGMHFDLEQIGRLVALADEVKLARETQAKARPKKKLSPAEFGAKLVAFELAAEEALRPGQLEVMDSYKPCLIPPKNLKNPVRVGQASDSTHVADWLERARSMPPKRVERMIDRAIAHDRRHMGNVDEAWLESRRTLLREAVARAAEMTDVEFALAKDEMAESIAPPDRKDELVEEIDTIRRQRREPGRTGRFLLTEGFAKVLKERYAQLSDPEATRSARRSSHSDE